MFSNAEIILILILLAYLAAAVGLIFSTRQLITQRAAWRKQIPGYLQAVRQRQTETRQALDALQPYQGAGGRYQPAFETGQGVCQKHLQLSETLILALEEDQKNDLPEPEIWALLLLLPALAQWIKRSQWNAQAQDLQKGIGESEALASQITETLRTLQAIPQKVKEEARTLLAQAENLDRTLASEARPLLPLQAERNTTREVMTKLKQMEGVFSSGTPLAKEEIVKVDQQLPPLRERLTPLEKLLGVVQGKRVAIVASQRYLQADVQKLAAQVTQEESAGRQMGRTRTAVAALETSLKEIAAKISQGDYDTATALSERLVNRIGETNTALSNLSLARQKMEAQQSALQREIQETQTWLAQLAALPGRKYDLDVTTVQLNSYRAQANDLATRIKAENLAELQKVEFLNVTRLAEARQKFETQRQTYETRMRDLEKVLPGLLNGAEEALKKLENRAAYKSGFNFSLLRNSLRALKSGWEELNGQTAILESKFIATLKKAEDLQEIYTTTKPEMDKVQARNMAWEQDYKEAETILNAPTLKTDLEKVRKFALQAGSNFQTRQQTLVGKLKFAGEDYGEVLRQARQLTAEVTQYLQAYETRKQQAETEYKRLFTELPKLSRELFQYTSSKKADYQVKPLLDELNGWKRRYSTLPAPPQLFEIVAQGQALEQKARQALEAAKTTEQQITEQWGQIKQALATEKAALTASKELGQQFPWKRNNGKALGQLPTRELDEIQALLTQLEGNLRTQQGSSSREMAQAVLSKNASASEAILKAKERLAKESSALQTQIKEIGALMTKLSDAVKLGEQTFRANPADYSEWTGLVAPYQNFKQEVEKCESYPKAKAYLENSLTRLKDFFEAKGRDYLVRRL